MPGMHTVANERRFAGEMLGLRNFACMMRKGKVGTAAVNINLRAEVAHGHGAALYMPARTAGPQGLGHAGSPGACACQRTKSSGSFLRISSGKLPRSLAMVSMAA